MPKFCVIKNFSFSNYKSHRFTDYSEVNLKKILAADPIDTVSFVDFDGTDNFVDLISKIFTNHKTPKSGESTIESYTDSTAESTTESKAESKSLLEVINCVYTESTLLQAIYSESSEESERSDKFDILILVKRKLSDDDSYTFVNHLNESGIDIYRDKYLDVDHTDVVTFIRSKFVHKCVQISDDGDVIDTECINLSLDQYTGILKFDKTADIAEARYVHYQNLSTSISDEHTFESKDAEQKCLNDLFHEKLSSTGSDYVFAQREITKDIYLDCYCRPFVSQQAGKNEFFSKLFGEDIFGDVILLCEVHKNEEERIVSLDTKLLLKLCDILNKKKETSDVTIKQKNPHFFNIFRELC